MGAGRRCLAAALCGHDEKAHSTGDGLKERQADLALVLVLLLVLVGFLLEPLQPRALSSVMVAYC